MLHDRCPQALACAPQGLTNDSGKCPLSNNTVTILSKHRPGDSLACAVLSDMVSSHWNFQVQAFLHRHVVLNAKRASMAACKAFVV